MPTIAGPPGYLEWTVPARLRRYAACSWTGGLEAGLRPPAEPVLPDGCTDIIWDGHRLFVAGPDTGPSPGPAGAPFHVGLRFRPGMGPLFLGVPAAELRDLRVDLGALWRDTDALAEELSAAPSLRAATRVLEAEVGRRLPGAGVPDALVEAAAAGWAGGVTPAATSDLAERAGLSPRQLHRRFVAAVGYGPKFLHRVLRFQAFLASCGSTGAGLADLAARAGYADQAHLTREARALSGMTPSQLRSARGV